MKIAFVFLSVQISIAGLAQKPPLRLEEIKDFPEIGASQISNDGKYLWYKIEYAASSTLILSSTDNSYRKEINGLPRNFGHASFTEDSRRFTYLKHGDTLSIVDLATKKEKFISGCSSYKVPDFAKTNWLAYQGKNNNVILYNLVNQRQHVFSQISHYIFSPNCRSIVLTQNTDLANTIKLLWIDLDDLSLQTVWSGDEINNLTFSKSGTKLAFGTTTVSMDEEHNEIWCYDETSKQTEKIIYDGMPGIDPALNISLGPIQFSNLGDKIFFTSQKRVVAQKSNPVMANVEVWHYKDELLFPEQARRSNQKKYYYSVIDLEWRKVIQLTNDGDANFYMLSSAGNNDFLWKMAIADNLADGKSHKRDTSIILVNTINGSQRLIGQGNYDIRFSPGGKYVYWYNDKLKNYYSYNIQKGILKSISETIPTPVYDESFTKGVPDRLPYGSTFWLSADQALFIYDRYDIWRVDPDGNLEPTCITKGYGRKHHIIFRLPYNRLSIEGADYFPDFKTDAIVHLNAFDEATKENGFFSLKYAADKNPEKLMMSAHYYYYSEPYTEIYFNLFLIKAKNANVFLLRKESASDFPNIYVTRDFKKLTQISTLAPQNSFNWLTSQLLCWNAFDGTLSRGILYKPENFDSTKKYPVIFYMYQRLSDGLNLFPNPQIGYTGMALNIPYFVSNGYLVFCPDIYYTQNHPGESVYNYVVSAAKTLSKEKYVDSTKFGMQGQSFGGFEVNYLATHTNLFAAASSSAGNSNLITTAGSLIDNSKDGHLHIQGGQYRISNSLWDSLNIWIDNSPVFNANRVTTPLLLLHGKKDTRVPWLQSVEFFTSLRLLKKKSWLLSYVDGDHCIFENDIDPADCVIRMKQFFDHFLTEKPAPVWMTQGAPAALKGIETGYELDPSGSCSTDCKICREWNEKTKKSVLK
jgi:dienelactone hydrolase